MPQPRTTIVIVPRESYSVTPLMLETVLTNTPEPRRIVLVLGGSPRRIRQRLERLASEHDFTFVHCDAVITPNEARNLAMQHVSTPYVCFLDNDTLVGERWLERLEQCADDTGASLVGCPVLWGRDDSWEIHYAGGTCQITDERGVRRLEEHNVLMHQPPRVLDTLTRTPTEYVEPHCLLARVTMLRKIGPFDEQLLIAREHSDLSLRVSAAGGAIWLEPSAVVMYPWPKRNTIADARLNLVRWSDEWSERSYRRFNEMWGLTDVSIDDIYRQGHHQRQLRRRPPTGRRVRARFARALPSPASADRHRGCTCRVELRPPPRPAPSCARAPCGQLGTEPRAHTRRETRSHRADASQRGREPPLTCTFACTFNGRDAGI